MRGKSNRLLVPQMAELYLIMTPESVQGFMISILGCLLFIAKLSVVKWFLSSVLQQYQQYPHHKEGILLWIFLYFFPFQFTYLRLANIVAFETRRFDVQVYLCFLFFPSYFLSFYASLTVHRTCSLIVINLVI